MHTIKTRSVFKQSVCDELAARNGQTAPENVAKQTVSLRQFVSTQ